MRTEIPKVFILIINRILKKGIAFKDFQNSGIRSLTL